MCHRVQKIHLSLRLPKELSAVIVRHFCRFRNLQSEKFLSLAGPAENGVNVSGSRAVAERPLTSALAVFTAAISDSVGGRETSRN